MPIISRFYGIDIQMFYNDHAPPHFHATYGDDELVVQINPIMIMEGAAKPRVKSMVMEWASLHQAELLANWQRCRTGQAPVPVEPLA